MRTLFRSCVLVAPLSLGAALACSVEPGGDEPAGTAGSSASAGNASGGASAGQATNGGSSSGGTASGGSTSGGAGTAGSNTGGLAGSGSSGSGAGGSAPTGGSTNTAGTSAGGAAPGGCVGVTSKFCDDFEAQAAGMPPKGDFTVDAKAGAVLVDTTKAYSGTKALHITTPKPGSTSFVKLTQQFPMNDFHGRAMFFLTRIPTAEIHWDLIDALSSNGRHWEIGGMYGKFIFVVDPPDHALTSSTFPTGKWFCLQWQFKYGGTANADNTFLAKMDNKVLDKGMFSGADPDGEKWAAGPWQNLNIGWTNYGGSDVDIEEWIDDLAIGDAPIPCPAGP